MAQHTSIRRAPSSSEGPGACQNGRRGYATIARAAFTVSATGVLAHRSAGGQRRQLVWMDRAGRAAGTVGGPDDAALANPALAPDGQRVAVSRNVQGNGDVWLLDVRGVLSRFTFDSGADSTPVWSHRWTSPDLFDPIAAARTISLRRRRAARPTSSRFSSHA